MISQQWISTPVEELQQQNFYDRNESQTKRLEAKHVKGLERVLILQEAVENLETKLEIEE